MLSACRPIYTICTQLLPLLLAGALKTGYGSELYHNDAIRSSNRFPLYLSRNDELQKTAPKELHPLVDTAFHSPARGPGARQETVYGVIERFDIKKESEEVEKLHDASRGLFGWAKILGQRGLTGLAHVIDGTKKAIGWMGKVTIKVGRRLVEAPVRGAEKTVNAAYRLKTLGMGLTNQIISDTMDWFEGNWQDVKAMEFPGKHLLIMLYPSGLVSVVDNLTKEITYMLDETHEAITHAFAYTMYASLKLVFVAVDTVIKVSHLDCLPLIPRNINVNRGLVQTIRTTKGDVCGISHLKPLNKITIKRNDDKFLIVSVPWSLDDVSMTLTGVNVASGYLGNVLSNQTMKTHVKHINATGTVEFESGTILRFVRIHIVVNSMDGINVSFPGQDESLIMEAIENMAGSFTPIITEEVNHALQKIEDKVFNYIADI